MKKEDFKNNKLSLLAAVCSVVVFEIAQTQLIFSKWTTNSTIIFAILLIAIAVLLGMTSIRVSERVSRRTVGVVALLYIFIRIGLVVVDAIGA